LRRAQSITTGVIMATMGALFRNADIPARGGHMRARPANSVRARPKMRRVTASIAPVSRRPADTTNSAPIVAMAGFENPEKVSAGVRMPTTASEKRPAIMIRSGPAISRTIPNMITARTPRVNQACQSMAPQSSGSSRPPLTRPISLRFDGKGVGCGRSPHPS
jgi:hypothetical protein